MKKNLIAILYCLWLCFACKAQTGVLTYHLNAPSGICDTEPFKLVFYDDFNGTSLDPIWRNYVTTSGGMTRVIGGITVYGDHEDWPGARGDDPSKMLVLLRPENIEVSGGSVKLKTKFEKFKWHCETCIMDTIRKDYTTAAITLPWDFHFSSGRFEAKIKLPTFYHSHAAFWLWKAGGLKVNELDITESYGDPMLGLHRRNTYTMHSWPPDPSNAVTNPHGLGHEQMANNFSSQSTMDYLRHRYFNQGDWHVYKCEWDSGVIRIYCDDKLENTFYRYYQLKSWTTGALLWKKTHTIGVGSGCGPLTGDWNIQPGFPYIKDTSNCQLRLGLDLDDAGLSPFLKEGTEMGQMEIDYVKVWQRHPEAEGHEDICSLSEPIINGPSVFAFGGTGTFTASPPISGATWDVMIKPTPFFPYVSIGTIAITSSNISSCNVTFPSSVWRTIKVVYRYSKDACIDQSVSKKVDLGIPIQGPTIMAKAVIGNEKVFHLATPYDYNSSTDFAWTINYGTGHSILTHGQFVSTPRVDTTEGDSVSWSLVVTNGAGQSTFTGNNFSKLIITNVQPIPIDTTDLDTSVYMFNALVTDTNAYFSAIDSDILRHPVVDTNDTIGINTMIERIMLEQLSPYIEVDTTAFDSTHAYRLTAVESITKIYPNPVAQVMNINLGSDYDMDKPVTISIISLSGKTEVKNTSSDGNRNRVLDLGGLATSMYIIELRQGNRVERTKFLKQ